MRWTAVGVLLAGCGPSERRQAQEICDRFLLCVAAVDASSFEDLNAVYGDQGGCWVAAPDDPWACGSECTDGLLSLWYRSEEPTCDPQRFGIEAEDLTLADFTTQFVDAYCDAYDACNTFAECPLTEEELLPTGCDFDPKAGRQCLDGTFVCNAEFEGYGYIDVPGPCQDVCGEQPSYSTDTD